MSAANLLRFKVNNKWGLKSKSKKDRVILDPVYDDIRLIKGTPFYIKMKINNIWGVLDCEGNVILPPEYDDIILFIDGFFYVIYQGNHKYVTKDKDGSIILRDDDPYLKANSLLYWHESNHLHSQSVLSFRNVWNRPI